MDGLMCMHAPTLLTAARAIGLVVSTTEGKLAVRGPRGAEGLVRLLLAHKAEIVGLLSSPAAEPPPPPRVESHPILPEGNWYRHKGRLYWSARGYEWLAES